MGAGRRPAASAVAEPRDCRTARRASNAVGRFPEQSLPHAGRLTHRTLAATERQPGLVQAQSARRGADDVTNDTMAVVVRQWKTIHPDLNTSPMELVGRINRCSALLRQAESSPLRDAGLSRGEFGLLGALRRTGLDLTPSELSRETFASGAAVTKRLRQLTERDLVERHTDERDRRVVHIRLTDAGRDVIDRVLPAQLDFERAVLAGLDADQSNRLCEELGELLIQLEGRLGTHRR